MELALKLTREETVDLYLAITAQVFYYEQELKKGPDYYPTFPVCRKRLKFFKSLELKIKRMLTGKNKNEPKK
jgi:hypothetical protein